MGCGHSKPKLRRGASAAVALCRDRSALLAEAIARRYALADAHRAYAASLCATGAALHDFLRAVQEATPLPLPEPDDQALADLPAVPRNNGDDDADAPAPAPAVTAPMTLAPAASDAQQVDDDGDDEDGHIHFRSSDEGEAAHDDEGRGGHNGISPDDKPAGLEPTLPRTKQIKQETPAPPTQPSQMAAAPYSSDAYHPPPQVPSHYSFGYPPPPYSYSSYGPVPGSAYGYGGGYEADMGGSSRQSSYDISYTQSHPPPSLVSYHQDQGPHVTDATIHYHYYQGHGQSDAIPSFYSQNGGYSYQYYPQSSQQGDGWPPLSASSSHQLPPPSPPMESSWGFLDPFEPQPLEGYYQDHPAYPAAQSSNGVGDKDEDMPELEEDEDIPELEEDKCLSSTTLGEDEDHHIEFKESSSDATISSNRSSTVHENGVEKDNNAVEEQLEEHSGVAEAEQPPAAASHKMYNNDIEVVQEIKLQFEHASKSAGDVCKMLEVGKMPHSQKNSGLKVSSMMIHRGPSMRKKFIKFEEEKAMECGNLSSSLQQLYWWEKKLLQEVKSTEKIRVLHDEKCKTLKKLYEGGAEAHKLEEAEVSIKKLSSKLDVSIRIVNNISYKINKMRDQELWPQTHEVIQGFMQMWDAMSECHRIQCHAMSQARNIDSTVAAAKFSEALMDLVKQLELQLLDMTTSFASWFSAQKSYASTLNEWLKRGIMYEPEVTDDGVAPFSPGRLGAPPIFTIYNNWATILGRISDAEVVGAMQALASNVLGIWEKHMSEWRKVVLAHSMDLYKDLSAMDKDVMWMRRAVEARNKKLVLISGQTGVPVSATQAVHEDAPPPTEEGLQLCMSKVFEAMESFTTACRNAYKDLHLRSEEERVSFATATCVDVDKDPCLCSGEEEARIAAACAMNADKYPPHLRTSEEGAPSIAAACTTNEDNDPQLRSGEEEKEKAAPEDQDNGSAVVPEIQTTPSIEQLTAAASQQHKA